MNILYVKIFPSNEIQKTEQVQVKFAYYPLRKGFIKQIKKRVGARKTLDLSNQK